MPIQSPLDPNTLFVPCPDRTFAAVISWQIGDLVTRATTSRKEPNWTLLVNNMYSDYPFIGIAAFHVCEGGTLLFAIEDNEGER